MYQRPYSAPHSLSNKDEQARINPVTLGKYEELCGWNTSPDNKREQHQQSTINKRNLTKKTSSRSSSKTAASSFSNTKPKYRSTKWLQQHGVSQIEFEFSFQHHTDTSEYISTYRRSKMAKIHDLYSDEIRELLNQRQAEVCISEPVTVNNTRTIPGSHVYIKTPVEPDEYPIRYRIEDKRGHASDSSRKKEWSSQKIKGTKLVNKIDEQRKERDYMFNNSFITNNLPKCDAIMIPHRPPVASTNQNPRLHHHSNANNAIDNDRFVNQVQNHALQCRKLSELSISKATRHYKHQKYMDPGWMPHDAMPPRESIKLRSAEERRRRTSAQSLKKTTPTYNHIIKRVLEHYDPSKNPVRARIANELTVKGLVATI